MRKVCIGRIPSCIPAESAAETIIGTIHSPCRSIREGENDSHTDVNKFKDLVKVFWETGAIPHELVETAVRLLKDHLTEQNSPSAKAPQDKPANLITRKKAAELLCCCTRTIDRLRKKGILKAVQYGTKSVRYREPDILSLQNSVLEQEESAKE